MILQCSRVCRYFVTPLEVFRGICSVAVSEDKSFLSSAWFCVSSVGTSKCENVTGRVRQSSQRKDYRLQTPFEVTQPQHREDLVNYKVPVMNTVAHFFFMSLSDTAAAAAPALIMDETVTKSCSRVRGFIN